jgi:WD40 repeat protein
MTVYESVGAFEDAIPEAPGRSPGQRKWSSGAKHPTGKEQEMKRMIVSLAAMMALAFAFGQTAQEEPKKETVKSAHFSPDGRLIVTTSADGTARVWDVQTGKEIIKSVQFSPDGRRIVTGTQDGPVRVWDAQTGQELSRLQRVTPLLGTWRLVSYKYGTNQSDFTDFPQTERRLKHITDTHFTWVQFDTASKRVSGAAGGTYSLSGNTYTESIDFGLEMDPYLGQKHVFSVKVDDDKLYQSGSLADGLKIEEVWQRVK